MLKEGNLRKANSEGSQSGRVLFSQNRSGPNPEGSYIYYFRGVPIRRGLIFANS